MVSEYSKRYNFQLFNLDVGMLYFLDSVEYDSEFGEFRYQGESEKLSAKGTKVFNYFLQNPSQLISYDLLMNDVWQSVVSENAVLQIITHIRQTYKKVNPGHEIIKNFRGKGFQLNQSTPIRSVPRASIPNKNMRVIIGLVVLILVIISLVWWRVKLNEGSDITELRMVILAVDNSSEATEFNLNDASESFLNQWFKLSKQYSLVNTSRISNWQEKQQLITSLRRTNDELLVVNTELTQENGLYLLSLKLENPGAVDTNKTFSDNSLQVVIIQAVDWLDQQFPPHELSSELPDWLPKDDYLVQSYFRGMAAFKQGEQLTAIDYFNLCLKQKNDFHLARLGLANALSRQGLYDRSLVELETLKALPVYDQMDLPIDNEMAAIELRRGALKVGQQMYQKLVEKYPLNARSMVVHMNLAIANSMLGFYDQAREQLLVLDQKFSAKKYPGYAAIIKFSLAGTYMYQQQFDEAEAYLTTSLQLFQQINDQDRLVQVYGRMAYIYTLMGQYNQAIVASEKRLHLAESLNNQHVLMGAYNGLVMLKIAQGKYDEAMSLNQKLHDMGVELGSIVSQLHAAQWQTVVALETKNFELAEQFAQQFWQLAQQQGTEPYKNGANLLKFSLALKTQDITEAKKWNELLKVINANDVIQSEYVPLKVEYLKQIEGIERAIQFINDFHEHPGHVADQMLIQKLDILLAEMYLSKDPKKSIELLQNMTVKEGNAHPYYWVLAQAYKVAGEDLLALKALQNARQIYNQRWTAEMDEMLSQVKLKLNQD